MDWGGHVHPTLFEDRFSNSSKFDENRLKGGGGRFWLITDRYSFPFVYDSVISPSHLVCVACNQPYGTLFLR